MAIRGLDQTPYDRSPRRYLWPLRAGKFHPPVTTARKTSLRLSRPKGYDKIMRLREGSDLVDVVHGIPQRRRVDLQLLLSAPLYDQRDLLGLFASCRVQETQPDRSDMVHESRRASIRDASRSRHQHRDQSRPDQKVVVFHEYSAKTPGRQRIQL